MGLTTPEINDILQAEARDVENGERLLIMRDVTGFMPLSEDELDEAFDLLSDPERTGDRLDEVAKRQRRVGAEYPSRAVRAVTHEYIRYARAGMSIGKSLAKLDVELKKPRNPQGFAVDVTTQKADLLAVAQFADVTAFAHGTTLAGSPLERDYSANSTDEYVRERLESLKIIEVRKALPHAIVNQAVRREFWRTRIETLQTHKIAGPIVKRAVRICPL